MRWLRQASKGSACQRRLEGGRLNRPPGRQHPTESSEASLPGVPPCDPRKTPRIGLPFAPSLYAFSVPCTAYRCMLDDLTCAGERGMAHRRFVVVGIGVHLFLLAAILPTRAQDTFQVTGVKIGGGVPVRA